MAKANYTINPICHFGKKDVFMLTLCPICLLLIPLVMQTFESIHIHIYDQFESKRIAGIIIREVIDGLILPLPVFFCCLTYCISAVQRIKEAKAFTIRESRYKNNDRLICEGPSSISGNRGWIFLSENALELYFYPTKLFRTSLIISFRDFEKVTSRHNRLSITTYKGTYTFKVKKVKMWISFIDKDLNSKQASFTEGRF